MQVLFLGQENPLEEGMAAHSSTLAWKMTWTEETWGGEVQPMESLMSDMTEYAHTEKDDTDKRLSY